MQRADATPDPEAWRAAARGLLAANIAPADVAWTPPGSTGMLFTTAPPVPDPAAPRAHVPPRFIELAADAVLHREPGAHALLYRVLWRLAHGAHGLLADAADPEVRALVLRAGAVRRDLHKMHAFVRFHAVGDAVDGPHYVAWYAPDHHIVARGAEHFRARFPAMSWAILTPDRSVSWDGETLMFAPGVPRHAAPGPDELEELWRTYYASTYNPARTNPRLMRQHMPMRFWSQLPESAEIPALLARAAPRVEAMIDPGASVPAARSLPVLAEAARRCTSCDLCGPATQTVFGEGPADAALVLVGEQPGDQEDVAGRPFVGPAGHVLDAALRAVGIVREEVYLTNAVKHFRFLPRGKTRLHQRPTADQVRACKPWLAAELETLRPRVVVCLGATAASSLIGSRFRISAERGRWVTTHWADALIATHHPAAILRVDEPDRPRYEAELRADLALAQARCQLGANR